MKHLIFVFSSVVFASVLCAQSTLAPPQVGFVLDTGGAMHRVLGIAGNFVIGRRVSNGIVSAGYSGALGLLKSDSSVIATDARGKVIATTAAPSGPAVIGFSADGQTAAAYLAGIGRLETWNGRALISTPLDPALLDAKAVLSVAVPSATTIAFVVERDTGLWELEVHASSGAVLSETALPNVTGPALLLGSGDVLYTKPNELIIRQKDGSEKRIAAKLPAKFAFEQMGAGWVQLADHASGRLFAIRVADGAEKFYALPEVHE